MIPRSGVLDPLYAQHICSTTVVGVVVCMYLRQVADV